MSEKINKEIEALKERYKQLDNDTLIKIVTVDRNNYTPRGIELARSELANRNIKIDQQEEQNQQEEDHSKTFSTENLLGTTHSNVRFFSKDWFIALWDGERPLWEAWIILGVALYTIDYFVFPFLVMIYPNLIMLFYYIIVFMQIFWWVSIWRCAQNTSKFILYISRGVALLNILGILAQSLT